MLMHCILPQTGRKKRIRVWTHEALSKPYVGKRFDIYYASVDMNHLSCLAVRRSPAGLTKICAEGNAAFVNNNSPLFVQSFFVFVYL
jgi:hypothetical protein